MAGLRFWLGPALRRPRSLRQGVIDDSTAGVAVDSAGNVYVSDGLPRCDCFVSAAPRITLHFSPTRGHWIPTSLIAEDGVNAQAAPGERRCRVRAVARPPRRHHWCRRPAAVT
jgi:hypothetical protein